MYLIVGLGNPGKEYATTRHNIGFMVLDALAEQINPAGPWKKRYHALTQEVVFNQKKFILAKPQTYMNNSGQSVAEIVAYYDIKPEDVIVIYDDFDIPLGEIRIRKSGSSGGHNGIQSIINALHTQDIPRLRLGIGNMEDQNFINKTIPRDQYVLSSFKADEQKIVQEMIQQAVQTVVETIQQD